MAEFTQEDDALLEELGVEVESRKTGGRTPREERIMAGFEEVQRFVAENGRAPQHGEDRDIFERLYAVRLDRMRASDEMRALLEPLDREALLAGAESALPPGFQETSGSQELEDDALLAELGTDSGAAEITELRHVRSTAERRAAEEIANREKCADFETFAPLFEKVKQDLKDGTRTTRPFVRDSGFLKADIKQGEFFVLGGQTAFVAETGAPIRAPNGETDARLRVIYSNGTESNLLLRSLQRALYKDEAGRRITEPGAGPLFADASADGDAASGTIYVLRSRSDDPAIAERRELLHKIGVTGGKVESRIANAKLDPTFLMAEVEIVATYELYNINRARLEKLIHRVFDPARLDIALKDRFGNPIVPREWFLVPLFVIDEAVEKIRDGSIAGHVYDPQEACLKRAEDVK